MTATLGAIVATLITLAVFSRAWRVNPLYRLASHAILGALTGYVAAITLRTVLFPGLFLPLVQEPGQRIWLAVVLLAILLLGLRLSRRPALRAWGLLPGAALAGGGAALLVAGAVRGTLVPQTLAALQLSLLPAMPLADRLLITIATITTVGVLLYLRRPQDETDSTALDRWLGPLATWGYLALMLALGALAASLAGARLTLLIDRVYYLINMWKG